MLAVGEYVVHIKETHDVADNDMLKHLTWYAGKGHWPIVTGLEPLPFLEDCRYFGCFPDIRYATAIEAFLVKDTQIWCTLFCHFLEDTCKDHIWSSSLLWV